MSGLSDMICNIFLPCIKKFIIFYLFLIISYTVPCLHHFYCSFSPSTSSYLPVTLEFMTLLFPLYTHIRALYWSCAHVFREDHLGLDDLPRTCPLRKFVLPLSVSTDCLSLCSRACEISTIEVGMPSSIVLTQWPTILLLCTTDTKNPFKVTYAKCPQKCFQKKKIKEPSRGWKQLFSLHLVWQRLWPSARLPSIPSLTLASPPAGLVFPLLPEHHGSCPCSPLPSLQHFAFLPWNVLPPFLLTTSSFSPPLIL